MIVSDSVKNSRREMDVTMDCNTMRYPQLLRKSQSRINEDLPNANRRDTVPGRQVLRTGTNRAVSRNSSALEDNYLLWSSTSIWN